MKPSCRVSPRASIFPAKSLAGIAVFCLLINCLVPRFSITDKNYATLLQVMGAQTLVMEMFCMSAVPLKIVGQLMHDAAGGAPAQKNRDQQSGTSAGASSDYSIAASDTRMVYSRHADLLPAGAGFFGSAGICPSGYAAGIPARPPVSPPIGLWLGIIALLFSLLPRSGLEDNALRVAVRNFSARFAPAIRVFYCPGGAL